MMRRIILIALLMGLAACATVPMDRDGGIGGTGAPAVAQPFV